ncbi:hypothetical protein SLA2020_096330 [Shorea laevis]
MLMGKSIAVLLVVMVDVCEISYRSNSYIVGDFTRWTNKGTVNYKKWASNKKFFVGDNLEINYDPQFHNVMQVSKEDFKLRKAEFAITSYNSGKEVVNLKSSSELYFHLQLSLQWWDGTQS